MKLMKCSLPDWKKEFATLDELRQELYTHICSYCRGGELVTRQDGTEWWVWEPVNENSSVDDMLNTGCGCEYRILEEEE